MTAYYEELQRDFYGPNGVLYSPLNQGRSYITFLNVVAFSYNNRKSIKKGGRVNILAKKCLI
jgi:hypothetical protein